MKCIACGEENVQNARFCAFCGAKFPSEAPVAVPEPEIVQEEPIKIEPLFSGLSSRQTARPLSENPYQPPRSPVIPSAQPVQPKEPEPVAEEPEKVAPLPRQVIKPAPQRVFLFDEEQEEADRIRRERELEAAARELEDLEEGFDDDESEYEDYDDDEDDEPSGGRIFVRVFSILTVLILIVGIFSFLFGTTLGRRLRASVYMSNEPEDYLLLADWQLEQNSLSAASESYHNAFKLDPENYSLAMKVGVGFENAQDDVRAEQLYVYLIQNFPRENEPYDRLMALLNRLGRTDEYQSLLIYREEHQEGFVAPLPAAPDAPVSNLEGGAYTGSTQITLDAGGNEIRYTLDGTAPTKDSLLYTGPINLSSGTCTIRAIAVNNGQVSPEWSGSFIIS